MAEVWLHCGREWRRRSAQIGSVTPENPGTAFHPASSWLRLLLKRSIVRSTRNLTAASNRLAPLKRLLCRHFAFCSPSIRLNHSSHLPLSFSNKTQPCNHRLSALMIRKAFAIPVLVIHYAGERHREHAGHLVAHRQSGIAKTGDQEGLCDRDGPH